MFRKCVFLSVVIVMILSLLACGGVAPVEEEEEEVEFTLDIRFMGRGTTSPKPGTSTIIEGGSVTVTAKPGKGYKFDRWKGDVSGTNTSITFKMTSDKRVVAVFVEEVIVEEVEAPPTPVSRNVSVTLDSGRSASAIITADGGTISTTAADGTPFTLSFPVEAVLAPTEVTLTPVSAMEGLPLSGDLVAALQLEPEGLRLLKPATLTIELSYLIPVEYLIGFAYYGTGEGFHLNPVEVNGTTLTFQLMHFSGIGAGTGTDYDCNAFASAIDDSLLPEARAQEQIAYTQATYKKDPEAAVAAFIDIVRAWFQESVLPGLNGADNWETFIKAESEFRKWLMYYSPLQELDQGLDADKVRGFEAIGDAIQRVLHKENALGICNTGSEDVMVHKERLIYLIKVANELPLNREELVWLWDELCTVSIDLKAVVPGTDTPLTGELELGAGETSEGRFELIATVTDRGGVAYDMSDMSELPCVSILWESCCPFTLAVNQDGVVTGIQPGKRCVMASITGIDDDYIRGNRTAEVMVTVTGLRRTIASISVDFVDGTEGRLARGLLFPGETARLIVTAKDKSGNPIPWPDYWDVKLVLFGPHGLETDHADCITVSEWEFSDQYSGVVSPSVLITAVEVGWIQPHVYVSGDGWSQDYGWKDVAVLPDLAGTWPGTYEGVENRIYTWGPTEFGSYGEYKKIYNTNWVKLTITHDEAGEGYLLQLSGELAWTVARSGETCIGFREVVNLETGEVTEVECVGLKPFNEMASFNHELAQTINIPYESSLSYLYQLWQDGETEDIWYHLIYNDLILHLYSPDHIRGYDSTGHGYFDLYR